MADRHIGWSTFSWTRQLSSTHTHKKRTHRDGITFTRVQNFIINKLSHGHGSCDGTIDDDDELLLKCERTFERSNVCVTFGVQDQEDSSVRNEDQGCCNVVRVQRRVGCQN